MRRRVPLTGAFVTRIVRDGVRRRSVRHKRLLPAWERKGNPLRPRPRAPWRGPRRDTGRPPASACVPRCGTSPCFRMESMRKRFACLKGNERKAESTQFRSPSRSRPRPPRAAMRHARGPCRSPLSAARPASRSRSHVPTSGAALRSEPVGIIPAFGSRCHSIGGIPACAPPHARSHHPCVQFRMQFRCYPPRRHHPDAQSFRNHPDMQPFRCNIVGITRPECTESPPISCIQAG